MLTRKMFGIKILLAFKIFKAFFDGRLDIEKLFRSGHPGVELMRVASGATGRYFGPR